MEVASVVTVGLFVLGAILGSFAGAQVWRLRARQLHEDSQYLKRLQANKSRTEAETLEYKELHSSRQARKSELARLSPLLAETAKTDRSRCLSCQHRLEWYDLLPVISWISARGRCRYCGQYIGRFELVTEAGLGLFWALSFALWPLPIDSVLGIAIFTLWLVASVPLAILFAYDFKWYLLPDVPMIAFIGTSTVYAGLALVLTGITVASLMSLLAAIAAIGGLYWLLHIVSRGRWVGYGDATLGVGLGLLLGQWPLAVLAVILANGIGTLLVLPALLLGKLDRQSHIPFGPLLIVGTVVAFFVGQPMIDWYLALL